MKKKRAAAREPEDAPQEDAEQLCRFGQNVLVCLTGLFGVTPTNRLWGEGLLIQAANIDDNFIVYVEGGHRVVHRDRVQIKNIAHRPTNPGDKVLALRAQHDGKMFWYEASVDRFIPPGPGGTERCYLKWLGSKQHGENVVEIKTCIVARHYELPEHVVAKEIKTLI
jgi:hypothetical protein